MLVLLVQLVVEWIGMINRIQVSTFNCLFHDLKYWQMIFWSHKGAVIYIMRNAVVLKHASQYILPTLLRFDSVFIDEVICSQVLVCKFVHVWMKIRSFAWATHTSLFMLIVLLLSFIEFVHKYKTSLWLVCLQFWKEMRVQFRS